MASLTVQQLDWDGMAPAMSAADAAGDEAPTGPGRFLYIANNSSGAVAVTVVTPGTVRGAAIEDAAPSVAAGGVHMLPLRRDLYADPSTGRAVVSYSATASVTVVAIEVPR